MKTRIIKRKGTLLSSVAMLSTAVLLTACGGDGGDSPVDDFGSNPGESENQALLYAYPDNGQNEISTAAPVVLRFSSAVNLGEAQNSITVYEGDAQTGTVVAVTPESVAKEPNNVLLQPDEDLKPNQTYTVVIEDLRLRKGTAKDQTLTFTTRPLHEGPKSLVVKDDAFEVSRRMPDGSSQEPVMDFSSFRFQFTQPVDRSTATYGDSVTLTSSGGDTVEATLLIDGAYMTVDPEPEYLNAGETYTLDITADLASTYGENFGAQSYTLTPKDSSPKGEPAILVQKLTQGNTSRLTGKPINQVPVNGTLLGENKNITQASAEAVRAELADVTTYTDVTPIRLPKGTVLNGAEINPILIGGEVDAGFASGDVTMTVLSDASGYLVPNPYAGSNPDALRIVHLLMDVGIATSEARANGAFTQDLLHIELVGLAEVDPTAGVLNLDAVSVVEPDILGQEYGYGMLSFQLQSYKDQNNPPQAVSDMTPPTLQSWMPGDNADKQSPSDPIVLNFNEAIDPVSVEGQVTLFENGAETAIDVFVDGSAVIIKPKNKLRKSLESQPYEYQLDIASGIADIAGNNYSPQTFQAFRISPVTETRTLNGTTTQVPEQAPLVLATYPGYPCALIETDLANDDAGRCDGSFPGITDEDFPDLELTQLDYQVEDDHLPVVVLPSNRAIRVQFSKQMDPDSIALGKTFKVQEINSDKSIVQDVSGRLNVTGDKIEFWPDSPWKEGALYQYVLASNGDTASSAADCTGEGAICDLSGLPLQTNWFANLTIGELPAPPGDPVDDPARVTLVSSSAKPANAGGPDMVQYFKGGPGSNNVLQTLVAAPSSDTNANMYHDAEVPPIISGGAMLLSVVADANPYTYLEEENGFDAVSGAAPNSARVVSQVPEGFAPPLGQNVAPQVNGVTVGCGPASSTVRSDGYTSFSAGECDQYKYTYMSTALNVEVTDQYVEGKGLLVNVWPSQIISTSLVYYPRVGVTPFFFRSQTGNQVLRMRYAKDGSGVRNQPIAGYIQDGADEPVLSVTVDLYLDAPSFQDNLPFPGISSNFLSMPLEMTLSGPVKFLPDGRMMVDQRNTAAVDIPVTLFGTVQGEFNPPISPTPTPLEIPEDAVWLRYISSSIK